MTHFSSALLVQRAEPTGMRTSSDVAGLWFRWRGLCAEWPPLRHGEGEDADLSRHVQGLRGLLCEDLQAGRAPRALPGHNASTGGQRGRERRPVRVLWVLPAADQDTVRTGESVGPQVGITEASEKRLALNFSFF